MYDYLAGFLSGQGGRRAARADALGGAELGIDELVEALAAHDQAGRLKQEIEA